MTPTDRVRMRVESIRQSLKTGHYAVVLIDHDKTTYLPIWIRRVAAETIIDILRERPAQLYLHHIRWWLSREGLRALRTEVFPDLRWILLIALCVPIQQVFINALVENTFQAEITLRLGQRAMVFPTGPSRAIIWALRCRAPIWVDRDILGRCGIEVAGFLEEKAALEAGETSSG